MSNPLHRSFASEYASLEALRADADIPRSLLPEMERLWQQSRTLGAPAPPRLPGLWHMMFGEWSEDEGDYD